MIKLNPELLVTSIICVNFFSIGIYAFLVRRDRGNAALFLGSFCIFLGLNQLYDVMTFNGVYGHYFRFLDEFSLLVAFPSLYFYVTSLTQSAFRFRKKHAAHLIPVIIFVMIWVVPPPFIGQFNTDFFFRFLYQYYNKIQGVIYIILINARINHHQKILKDISSTAGENDLSWIRTMVIILILITFLWTLGDLEKDEFNFTGYGLLVFSYWIGYHAIIQKSVYTGIRPGFEIEDLKENVTRYRNSNLSPQEKSDMAERIRSFMATEKPYLNNELTLTSLADRLKMKPIHLSQILNEEFNENFYNFINRHRVDESKKLLLDRRYSNYNILGIALEAGFNSKSTFNKAFKEKTGISHQNFSGRQYVRLSLGGRSASFYY